MPLIPAVPLHLARDKKVATVLARPMMAGLPMVLLPFSEDEGLVRKYILISAPPRRPYNSHINHNNARRISTLFFCFLPNIPRCGMRKLSSCIYEKGSSPTRHPSPAAEIVMTPVDLS